MTGYTELVEILDITSAQIKCWRSQKFNGNYSKILLRTLDLAKVIQREVQGNEEGVCSLYHAIKRASIRTRNRTGINLSLRANLQIMEKQHPRLAEKKFEV